MKDHLNLFQPGNDTFYHRDSVTRDSLVGIGLTTNMAIPVVEFSREGYKIGGVFG